MSEALISVKGQVVIPAELRRKYGIKPGARIYIFRPANALAMTRGRHR